MSGFGIIMPALPYYTLEMKGDSRTVGLLLASYSAMNVLFSPLWGRLSDRIGRKPVLLLGISGLSVSFLLFGLADSMTEMFVARIFGGIVGTAALPTAFAYVGDRSTPENRGKAMGLMGAGLGLGMVVGPAMGGLTGQFGYHTPFFLAAGLSMLTALFTTFWLPHAGKPEGPPRETFVQALSSTGRHLWPFYLISFLQTFAFTNLEATYVLFAKDEFQQSIGDVGVSFTIMALVSAAVQGGLVGRLITRFGEKPVAWSGAFVLGLGFFLMTQVATPVMLTVDFCLMGVGAALLRTALATGVSRGAHAGQGTAMGMLQGFEALARVFGPAVGGALYFMNRHYPYMIGAVLMGLVLVLSMAALPKREHQAAVT